MIRPATLADRDQLYELAINHAGLYEPLLHPEKEKIMRLLTTVISATRHYIRVSERNGKIKGALVATTSENVWARKQCCNVIFWASAIAGEGATMLRQFVKWLEGRQVIRVAGFAPDITVDPRIWDLAQRIGFAKHGGAYLWCRGAHHGLI